MTWAWAPKFLALVLALPSSFPGTLVISLSLLGAVESWHVGKCFENESQEQLVQPLWKPVWQVLRKLNTEVPYDPAIALPGIYPREMRTDVWAKPGAWMFRAALLITAPKWK